MNAFTAIMGAAMVDGARREWSRVPPPESMCIDQKLSEQRLSISALIQNGVFPNDPRVAGARFDCRTAAFAPSNVVPEAPSIAQTDITKLSERPTFDCSRAKSIAARTLCFSASGPTTDWDLVIAYWARYFTLPEPERESFDQGQQSWLRSLNQNCPKAPNPEQCVLAAYHKRAASFRSQLAEDALAESRLTPEQHAKIQQSLIALGVLDGEPDGEFGAISRSAIRRFQAQAGAPQDDFLTAEQRKQLLGQPANSNQIQQGCRVADPTGTLLNVREAPNGPIVGSLTNGTSLQIIGNQQDTKGRTWVQIQPLGDDRPLGWAFRDYVNCSPGSVAQGAPQPLGKSAEGTGPTAAGKGAQAAEPSTQAPPPQPPPRIETARLTESRVFLEDIKVFLGQQKSVPSISEIAKAAANLQIALSQFDETRAVDAAQRLGELLNPVDGFVEFEQRQQAKRAHDEARHLEQIRARAKENQFFIDDYLQGHLGSSLTEPLLNLRAKIENSLKSNVVEEISKTNDDVAAFVKANGLADGYKESAAKFETPPPTIAKTKVPLKDLLTEKSRFLVEGPADDIVLLYNTSPTAPRVWKNVRGDVVFQEESAAACFAQSKVETALARYVDHFLSDRGARKITSMTTPCDLSKAREAIDVIAFQRGGLLNSNADYVLALGKMLDEGAFRKYETISNYNSDLRNRQILSLEIERDLDRAMRKGFGVISVTEVPVTCVVPPAEAGWGDGLKELFGRNADLIAPTLNADWQYVETPTTDLALRGLQRHQCGYVLANETSLQDILAALRRDSVKYAFAPVWWHDKQVAEATFDVHDIAEQEVLKKKEAERKQNEENALKEQRNKDTENQRTEIERKLREANGTKARGLMGYVQGLVGAMADQRPAEGSDLFPGYSAWLNQRFADHWETFSVYSSVADFGTVQWQSRQLDAVVVETIIQQKNRILGKYDIRCYRFGFVNDDEFNMLRDPFVFDCSDKKDVTDWKIGEHFQSRWNAADEPHSQ